MGFLDPAKLLVVLVLALIVLGPDRLPKAARQLGAAWRELTRVRDQVTDEIRSAIPDLDLPNIPRMPKNMVSGFIADLTKPSVAGVGGEAAGEASVDAAVGEAPGEVLSSSATGAARDGASGEGTSAAGADPETGWHAPDPVELPAGRRPGAQAGAYATVPLPLFDDDPSMN